MRALSVHYTQTNTVLTMLSFICKISRGIVVNIFIPPYQVPVTVSDDLRQDIATYYTCDDFQRLRLSAALAAVVSSLIGSGRIAAAGLAPRNVTML